MVTVKLWQQWLGSHSAYAGVAESATLAIDAKAKALVAAGEDVIGFGAGEPDFPTPPHIVAAAVEACSRSPQPQVHARRRPPGAAGGGGRQDRPGFRLRVAAAQVLITNGGKQAVEQTFATLLDPGDEVLLPAPYWTTYPEVIRLAGGVPVEVPTTWEDGFKVTVDQLEAARTATDQGAAVRARRPTRPGPSTHRTRSRPSGAGRSSTACGS